LGDEREAESVGAREVDVERRGLTLCVCVYSL
jgi:hypothetical protein